jgi:hypothetical protein
VRIPDTARADGMYEHAVCNYTAATLFQAQLCLNRPQHMYTQYCRSCIDVAACSARAFSANCCSEQDDSQCILGVCTVL